MILLVAPPDAVVFDCDGLLLDTETAWGVAEQRVLVRYGGTPDPGLRSLLRGRSIAGSAAILASRMARPPAVSRVETELVAGFRDLVEAGGVRPMPGALALLEQLAGWTGLAVASNTPRPLLDLLLDRSGVGGYFTELVGPDPRLAAKPAPDVYAEACRRLGAAPGRSHALEDSATGALAAIRAGLSVTVVGTVDPVADARHAASLVELGRDRLRRPTGPIRSPANPEGRMP